MSSRSSSSSIRSNGSSSNINNNCIRTSQPPITRPLTSPTLANVDNNGKRASSNLRSSHPSKKVINSSLDRQASSRHSSLRNSTTPAYNARATRTVSGRQSTLSFGIKSYLNDQSCISLRNQLMGENDDQDISDPTQIYDELEDSQLQNLISHLKEYEQQNAINENYIEASKAHHLNVEINEILKIRKKNEITTSLFSKSRTKSRKLTTTEACQSSRSNKQRDDLSFQAEEEENNSINSDISIDNKSENNKQIDNETITMNQMQEFDQIYQEKINKYQSDTDTKISQLNKLHEQQIMQLEKTWKEQKPARYRKPSAQLLQLKTIEKNLAITGDYDRAMILHKETESLMKREMNEAQKRLVYDYKNAKSKLLEKQNLESNQLEKLRNDGLTVLQNEYKLKRQQYENRNKVIQQQKAALASKRLNLASQSLSFPAPILAEKVGEIQTNLLPELIPPNDPDFVKEEERKAREENKRKLGMQQKNIDAASHYYKIEKDNENSTQNNRINSEYNENYDLNQTKKDENIENGDLNDNYNNSRSYINNQNDENGELNDNNNSNPSKNEENKENIDLYINDTINNSSSNQMKNNENIESDNNNSNPTQNDEKISDEINGKFGISMKVVADTLSSVAGSNNEKIEIKAADEVKVATNENEQTKSENEQAKSENEQNKKQNEQTKSENEQVKSENEQVKSENEQTKSENEQTKSENKNELKNEPTQNSNNQNENEQKVIHDITLISSLVGSADPQSSEVENKKEQPK